MNIVSMSLDDRSFYHDCPIGMGITQSYSGCPAKSNSIDITIISFDLTTSFASTKYHSNYTTRHVLPNTENLNNSNIYVTFSLGSTPSVNASLFGKKDSYNNVNIIMMNENANMSWGSDSYGFAFL